MGTGTHHPIIPSCGDSSHPMIMASVMMMGARVVVSSRPRQKMGVAPSCPPFWSLLGASVELGLVVRVRWAPDGSVSQGLTGRSVDAVCTRLAEYDLPVEPSVMPPIATHPLPETAGSGSRMPMSGKERKKKDRLNANLTSSLVFVIPILASSR